MTWVTCVSFRGPHDIAHSDSIPCQHNHHHHHQHELHLLCSVLYCLPAWLFPCACLTALGTLPHLIYIARPYLTSKRRCTSSPADEYLTLLLFPAATYLPRNLPSYLPPSFLLKLNWLPTLNHSSASKPTSYLELLRPAYDMTWWRSVFIADGNGFAGPVVVSHCNHLWSFLPRKRRLWGHSVTCNRAT